MNWLIFYVERSWGVSWGRETKHAENVCWETEPICNRYDFKCI